MKVLFVSLSFLLFNMQALATVSLNGRWSSDCNTLGRHSYKAMAEIEQPIQSVNFKLYEDSHCTSHSLTVRYEAEFWLGGFAGEGIEFSAVPSNVQLTIHLQMVVDQYNQLDADGCGLKDWRVNVEKNVEGRFCRPFQMPNIGYVVYDIYKISDNNLRFGGLPLRWEMNTPDSRPKVLSSVIFHRVGQPDETILTDSPQDTVLSEDNH